MKNFIPIIAFFIAPFLVAQEKDELITESISANVYKPEKVDATEERISSLKLPEGFEISKFAEGLEEPRILQRGPGNNIYVTQRNGDIILLKDSNGDGKANEKRVVANKDQAHGMAYKR